MRLLTKEKAGTTTTAFSTPWVSTIVGSRGAIAARLRRDQGALAGPLEPGVGVGWGARRVRYAEL